VLQHRFFHSKKIFVTVEILSSTRIAQGPILALFQQRKVKFVIINATMATEPKDFMCVNPTLLKGKQLSTKSTMVANVFASVTHQCRIKLDKPVKMICSQLGK
jgi:hypothetical protein